jgi:transcription elongation factor
MTRMRVDVQTERIEIANRRYRVRDGYAEMPQGDANLARIANIATPQRHAVQGGAATECGACGFRAWSWSAACPRCAHRLAGPA